ncbi:MAG: hypothetical protein F6K53_20385 [Moorea sp. SIO4A1]|uniref:hypothetical protein n=1 Tax=Moorena sp. SIO4A1 TaxID=2607835 RepID=UPI001418991F|nr:hypothetical protein [Moorena sp. SIO4A1]NEO43728.1 hypothetical protein [Moorena sp. SIO4A3]NEQ59631.1 hypothetical protein [Moorena sp. SIO4A1]
MINLDNLGQLNITAQQFQATGDRQHLDVAIKLVNNSTADRWTPQQKVAALQLLADKGAVLEGNLIDLILPKWQQEELHAATEKRYEGQFTLEIRFEFIWEEGRGINNYVPVLRNLIRLVGTGEAKSPLNESWVKASSYWAFSKAYTEKDDDGNVVKRWPTMNRAEYILVKYPTLTDLLK